MANLKGENAMTDRVVLVALDPRRVGKDGKGAFLDASIFTVLGSEPSITDENAPNLKSQKAFGSDGKELKGSKGNQLYDTGVFYQESQVEAIIEAAGANKIEMSGGRTGYFVQAGLQSVTKRERVGGMTTVKEEGKADRQVPRTLPLKHVILNTKKLNPVPEHLIPEGGYTDATLTEHYANVKQAAADKVAEKAAAKTAEVAEPVVEAEAVAEVAEAAPAEVAVEAEAPKATRKAPARKAPAAKAPIKARAAKGEATEAASEAPEAQAEAPF